MSEPSASSTTPVFKPYVAAETEMTESTIGAIVLGSILGIVFAAASVYAGLKIGLTTSALGAVRAQVGQSVGVQEQNVSGAHERPIVQCVAVLEPERALSRRLVDHPE